MPINATHRYLFIANTLRFPADSSRLGIASLIKGNDKVTEHTDPAAIPKLLTFEEHYATEVVERQLLVEDVAAVFIPKSMPFKSTADTWWSHGVWMTGPELALISTLNLDSTKDNVPDPATPDRKYALLFVLEHVRMLNIVSSGASAAECHEYVYEDECGGEPCCKG